MSEIEKIELIEDILEIERGSLKIDSMLDNYPEWDSLAIISLLTYFESEMNIIITPQKIKNLKKVSEIIDMMKA